MDTKSLYAKAGEKRNNNRNEGFRKTLTAEVGSESDADDVTVPKNL